uniref:transposase n=1 Tax=Aurantiacibacter arachoides TaxID=1850444 RepID=UPI00103BB76F
MRIGHYPLRQVGRFAAKASYVCRDVGATVNGIEGFQAQLKRGINGTHTCVSAKHLSKYLVVFEFRHDRPQTMLTS